MKNKGKGFVGIAFLIVLGLLLVGGGAYYYHAKNSVKIGHSSDVSIYANSEDNEINNYNNSTTSANITKTQTRLNLRPFLWSDSCSTSSITNPNNSNVLISKRALLNLGIGQQYFQDHFKFVCASDANTVVWQYTIGDYTIELDDSLGYTIINGTQQFFSNFPNLLHGLSEIKTVISKNAAANAMKVCIGNFTMEHVILGYPFSNYNYQTFNIKTDYSRPLLIASPTENPTNCPGAGLGIPCFTKLATIDLTTGKCMKNY